MTPAGDQETAAWNADLPRDKVDITVFPAHWEIPALLEIEYQPNRDILYTFEGELEVS